MRAFDSESAVDVSRSRSAVRRVTLFFGGGPVKYEIVGLILKPTSPSAGGGCGCLVLLLLLPFGIYLGECHYKPQYQRGQSAAAPDRAGEELRRREALAEEQQIAKLAEEKRDEEATRRLRPWTNAIRTARITELCLTRKKSMSDDRDTVCWADVPSEIDVEPIGPWESYGVTYRMTLSHSTTEEDATLPVVLSFNNSRAERHIRIRPGTTYTVLENSHSIPTFKEPTEWPLTIRLSWNPRSPPVRITNIETSNTFVFRSARMHLTGTVGNIETTLTPLVSLIDVTRETNSPLPRPLGSFVRVFLRDSERLERVRRGDRVRILITGFATDAYYGDGASLELLGGDAATPREAYPSNDTVTEDTFGSPSLEQSGDSSDLKSPHILFLDLSSLVREAARRRRLTRGAE